MGVYYLQHRYYVKSLACFKRSMGIRTQKLTEYHESVTDCMYNIGIVYKQMGKKQKAYGYLEKTLHIRRQVIGESSLPVAQTLEILGKRAQQIVPATDLPPPRCLRQGVHRCE